MRSGPRSVFASAVLVVAVAAATACAADGPVTTAGDAAATTPSTTAAVPSTVAATPAPAATAPGGSLDQPVSIEAWEARWAEERRAVVDRIRSEGWGTSPDGTTVRGPGGFTVDLTACPSGWSDTEGLTDDTIRIGQVLPQSGSFADYGNQAKVVSLLFDHYGEAGAFTDAEGRTRRVEHLVRDDQYDPARTIPLVSELVDDQRVFSVWLFGTAAGLRLYDQLNERCIPHPFVLSGHPAWGDPVGHPWTTGAQLAYPTEATIWAEFVGQRIDELADGPDGSIDVAALVIDNEFGAAYDSSFRAALADSPVGDRVTFTTQVVDAQAPTITDAMTTLAAGDPDVFIAMVGGGLCTQAIVEAAQNGLKESAAYLFQPVTCKAASFVGRDKVGGDGSAADGWWIVGGGVKDLNDPATADPYLLWARQLLVDAGLDPAASGSYGSGFQFAFPLVQSLQIAGQLEGGLTRGNLIAAVRAFDMTNPMLLPGIRFDLNGNDDAYFTEGSELSRYDAARQTWVQQGDVIDVSGRSGSCAFDATTGTCR